MLGYEHSNFRAMIKSRIILIISVLALMPVVPGKGQDVSNTRLFTDNVFHLSEVMLHDVANPVAASRFYAYAILGAYEIVYLNNNQFPDISAQFKVNPDFIAPVAPLKMNRSFCAVYAMLEVGKLIMPSGYLLEKEQQALITFFKKNRRMTQKSIIEQVDYARAVAAQVVQYAKGDGYNKLSTYTRYRPNKAEGHWYPTPPEYMGAVEPQWRTIRPFFLDSAAQFAPPPPVAFSKDSTSLFFSQMKEVYDITKNLSADQKSIASFWDCNPFAVTYSGHMAIGLKKISPGGHWLGITGIACNQTGFSLDSAILAHTAVALTLHDAFISCWTEKYSSDRIRPESAINKMMDPSWRPLLQTPPFPEYSSGHSVASAAAASVLSHIFGDNFSYTDTSEIYFGLPERRFNSFHEAAREAAISRLYGGIHFRDACENGFTQGQKVGNFIIDRFFKNSY